MVSVTLSGISCTPQQARAEPQFDAAYLARKSQFEDQWKALATGALAKRTTV